MDMKRHHCLSVCVINDSLFNTAGKVVNCIPEKHFPAETWSSLSETWSSSNHKCCVRSCEALAGSLIQAFISHVTLSTTEMALVHYPAEGVPSKDDKKYSQFEDQPGAPGAPMAMECTTVTITTEPRDHVVWSLANFFYANFCCLGLAALICSIKARDRKRHGDMAGARRHGSTAFILNTVIAVLIGVLIIVTIVTSIYEPGYSFYVVGYLKRRL
ncbi:dispanin subfamily A member 2b-like [Solea senegalensis]|uniref:Dispanin subfamily A member 2b-like n=1 Tax=Solea senegalensis TaxID=28829 RepID=A0AAV6SF89_SOLSE|nr:interferon-induced transmembrane protein 3-like [Solea senegalensis]KAG7515327.1 dispanin subfamily A member 2b-like [Solea senegalensis]